MAVERCVMNKTTIFARSMLRKLRLLDLIKFLQSALLYRRKKELALKYKRTVPKSVRIGKPPVEAELGVVDCEQYVEMRLDREPRVLDFVLNSVKSKQTAWDVGANHGYFTLILGKLVGDSGTVVAFEPEPETLRQLEKNIKSNNLDNVKIVPTALSNSSGRSKMHISDRTASGVSHLVYDQDQEDNEMIVEVEVTRGDTLVNNDSVAVPNFIKIDAEGFELEVLQGLEATLDNQECRIVLCEVHFALMESRGLRYNALTILELLRRHDFSEIFWLDTSHLVALKHRSV